MSAATVATPARISQRSASITTTLEREAASGPRRVKDPAQHRLWSDVLEQFLRAFIFKGDECCGCLHVQGEREPRDGDDARGAGAVSAHGGALFTFGAAAPFVDGGGVAARQRLMQRGHDVRRTGERQQEHDHQAAHQQHDSNTCGKINQSRPNQP